jgi:hypothetical protein
MIQFHHRYGKIVGGAAPWHSISIPEDDDGNSRIEITDSFSGDNATKKTAYEVKVVTVCYQHMYKKGISPFLSLIARPQTKNESSDFNKRASKIMEKAEEILREKGYCFSYLSSANDGVSCDGEFVQKGLLEFLAGDTNYSTHTDTNHNVKNYRYQGIIGGNSVKTIGNHVIDTGLLKKIAIPNELYRIKDFASDSLVLRLNSADTVSKILMLENQDAESQITLSLALYFNRVHLFAVNCKRTLRASERVTMLWSSLLFSLHVDGVSIITKRNWIVECVSLSFLMLRSDVTQPHRLTEEPSEHFFAILRTIVREFTLMDFLNLISKFDRYWLALQDGKLKSVRDNSTAGYRSTVGAQFNEPNTVNNGHGGPVHISTNPGQNTFYAAAGMSVAAQLWKELRPILVKVNEGMKSFLKGVCGVKEFHL